MSDKEQIAVPPLELLRKDTHDAIPVRHLGIREVLIRGHIIQRNKNHEGHRYGFNV